MGEVFIKDIHPGLKTVNITCIILEISNPVVIKKEKREVRTAKVADITACINLSVWDEIGKCLNPGDIIHATSLSVIMYRNSLTVSTNKNSKLQKIGEFCMIFNETINMSEPVTSSTSTAINTATTTTTATSVTGPMVTTTVSVVSGATTSSSAKIASVTSAKNATASSSASVTATATTSTAGSSKGSSNGNSGKINGMVDIFSDDSVPGEGEQEWCCRKPGSAVNSYSNPHLPKHPKRGRRSSVANQIAKLGVTDFSSCFVAGLYTSNTSIADHVKMVKRRAHSDSKSNNKSSRYGSSSSDSTYDIDLHTSMETEDDNTEFEGGTLSEYAEDYDGDTIFSYKSVSHKCEFDTEQT